MRTVRIISPILLVAMLAIGRAQAAIPHARAELLADVSGITPGKPFWLGVRINIDPHWHIYWKNPGDAGAPTQVKFELPKGFSAGELQFPTPHRFEQAGDIVAFGYENSVLLLAQVTPPKVLSKDFQGEFKAIVSWLVCSDVCIPGQEDVSLSLGVSDSQSPANVVLFDSFKAQLPVSAARSSDVATVIISGEIKTSLTPPSGDFVLEIDWNHVAPKEIQFLPGALEIYNLKNLKIDSQNTKTRISFTIEALAGKSASPATLESVIGYQNKDAARRGIAVSIALPKAAGN
jgi:thiol:disulfide interchange protein DsbD